MLEYGDAVFEYKVPGEKSLWFPYTCDVCENCLIYRLEKSVARYLAGTLGDGEQTIIIVTGFETPAAVREYTGWIATRTGFMSKTCPSSVAIRKAAGQRC